MRCGVPPDRLPGRQITQKQHHGQHHWHPWLQQTGPVQAGFAPHSNSPSHRQLFHLLSTVSGVFSRLNTSTLSISSFHTRLIFKNPALKDLPVSQANLKPSLILPLGHQQILLLLTPKVLWSLAASHHTHHSHCGHTQPYTPMAVLLCWGPLYGLFFFFLLFLLFLQWFAKNWSHHLFGQVFRIWVKSQSVSVLSKVSLGILLVPACLLVLLLCQPQGPFAVPSAVSRPCSLRLPQCTQLPRGSHSAPPTRLPTHIKSGLP